jgi:hypothetical protein
MTSEELTQVELTQKPMMSVCVGFIRVFAFSHNEHRFSS